MKKILFCTDLTENSDSALDFAIEIAKRTHAKIVALHSYFIPVPLGDGTFQPPSFDINRMRIEQEKEIGNLCRKIESHEYEGSGHMECDGMVTSSYPVSEVLDEADRQDADLIVMGSATAPVIERWFGTIGSQVASKSIRPVLIVPAEAQFSKFRNIIYATDLKEAGTRMRDVISFGKKFNSKITVLHVSNPDYDVIDSIQFSIFKERVLGEIDYPLLKFDEVSSRNTLHALSDYATDKGADLMILCKHSYSFIEGLFHRSVSNKIIFESRFPVLIIH